MNKEHYLNYEDIIEEVDRFYKYEDMSEKFKNPSVKKSAIKEMIDRIDLLNNLTIWFGETQMSLEERFLGYLIMCPAVEYLIRVCLIFDNHEFYFNNCHKKNCHKKGYYILKEELIGILKKKRVLNEEQIKRIGNILEFFRIQRNNYLHMKCKRKEYYFEKSEFFLLVLVLCKIFEIKIEKTNLKKAYEEEKERNGKCLYFKDVGLDEFI